MEVSTYSSDRFFRTLHQWEVQEEYGQIMFNYLVHGFEPGGFFTALLANDAVAAFSKSHPANQIQDLKNLVGWIANCMPTESRGSYTAVNSWLRLDDTDRRQILEQCRLIYPQKEETWMTLRGDKTDPMYHRV